MEKATAIYPNDKKLAYVSIFPSFLVTVYMHDDRSPVFDEMESSERRVVVDDDESDGGV